MCGFAGFCGFEENLLEEKYLWAALAARMARRLSHRGPDGYGAHVSKNCALAHRRLSVIDPEGGAQPMSVRHEGFEYTIAYNGELYNAPELKSDLEASGFSFETQCDTEVLLKCYIKYGEDCPQKLNGIFAFAVDDPVKRQVFLCRDRFGVKPLFYSLRESRLAFGSEIKSLFEYPGINPVIKREGLCEVFGLGPARTPGHGVFEGVSELLPARFAVFDSDGFRQQAYFKLEAHPHEDSFEKTSATVCGLLQDIIHRQLVSDVPLCTFLSGGLDSSVVTALAADELRRRGASLSTFSFELEGNREFFSPSSFQPESDDAYAKLVSDYLNTWHTRLICSTDDMIKDLNRAVIAKDLPGMSDIDSTLLYFCGEVKKTHTVALCGECADEIFGGYPWFHRPEMYDGTAFPWSNNLKTRESLLAPELAAELNLKGYVSDKLSESLSACPVLRGEQASDRRMRELFFLNINWFMATLLDRKDRCSMASGLEVRVPYADHRLISYIFNVPWAYKCKDGINKAVLKAAVKGLLPDDVISRRKSPYPKTYNPEYERRLKQSLKLVLSDKSQPVCRLLSKDTVHALCNESFDYGSPWFGQLMAGPQMLAYILEINYWLSHYSVRMDI